MIRKKQVLSVHRPSSAALGLFKNAPAAAVHGAAREAGRAAQRRGHRAGLSHRVRRPEARARDARRADGRRDCGLRAPLLARR